MYENSCIKSDAVAQIRSGQILMTDKDPSGHWTYCTFKNNSGYVLRSDLRVKNHSPTAGFNRLRDQDLKINPKPMSITLKNQIKRPDSQLSNLTEVFSFKSSMSFKA